MADAEQISTWTFEVFENSDGSVYTTYDVETFWRGEALEEYRGGVRGNLYEALQAAVDAQDLIFPYIPDPDLQAMSGGLE